MGNWPPLGRAAQMVTAGAVSPPPPSLSRSAQTPKPGKARWPTDNRTLALHACRPAPRGKPSGHCNAPGQPCIDPPLGASDTGIRPSQQASVIATEIEHTTVLPRRLALAGVVHPADGVDWTALRWHMRSEMCGFLVRDPAHPTIIGCAGRTANTTGASHDHDHSHRHRRGEARWADRPIRV